MIAVLACLVAFSPASEAVDLEWDAPAGCPDLASMRARIEAERVDTDAAVEPVRLRARAIPPASDAEPWRLELELGDGGPRTIEGESCAAVADAAAVMVAISLDAGADLEAPAVPPAPSEEPSAPIERDPASPVDTPPEPREPSTPPPRIEGDRRPPTSRASRGRSLEIVIGGVGAVHGLGLPAPGGGVGGRLGVRWGPLAIAATGMHFIRRERAVIEDVSAAFRLTVAAIEGCGVLARGSAPARIELVGCGVAEAGRVWGRGIGASPSRTRRHPWVALGGGAGVVWIPWRGVGISLRGDVLAPLVPRTFSIGTLSAGRVGPVDLRGLLAIEARIAVRAIDRRSEGRSEARGPANSAPRRARGDAGAVHRPSR